MCILSRQSPSCHPVPHPVIHPHACTHAQSASAIYLCLHSTSVPRSIHSSFTPSRSEKGTFFLSFFFCVFFCLLFCVHFFFFFLPYPFLSGHGILTVIHLLRLLIAYSYFMTTCRSLCRTSRLLVISDKNLFQCRARASCSLPQISSVSNESAWRNLVSPLSLSK